MKKRSVQVVIIIFSVVMLVGSIMTCQNREAAAPPTEIVEADDSTETADSVLTVQMERRNFEALVKIADGGKVYALDADGKRSAKAFKTFDEYEKFITDNPQYLRNRYSYDADGKPINFKTTD